VRGFVFSGFQKSTVRFYALCFCVAIVSYLQRPACFQPFSCRRQQLLTTPIRPFKPRAVQTIRVMPRTLLTKKAALTCGLPVTACPRLTKPAPKRLSSLRHGVGCTSSRLHRCRYRSARCRLPGR